MMKNCTALTDRDSIPVITNLSVLSLIREDQPMAVITSVGSTHQVTIGYAVTTISLQLLRLTTLWLFVVVATGTQLIFVYTEKLR
jgi:hypothetical protein